MINMLIQVYHKNLPTVILFGLPILGVLISCYHAVNIPLLDDYGFVLNFLDSYTDANSFAEKLKVVFAPSNNYLFITFRILVLLDYALFNQVSFVHLIYANNVFLLLIIWIIWNIFRQESISLKFFLPVVILFSVPNFEIHNWASYAAHVLGILFILTTIWCLAQRKPKYFWLALIAAVLAVFSAPGGFLAFLVPFPILFSQYQRWQHMTWGFSFVFILIVYVLLILPLGQEIEGTLPANNLLITYALNFILFFGSFFKGLYRDYQIWAVIFGLIIFLMLVWIFLMRFTVLKKHRVVAGGLLFAVLLAMVITLMRSRYGVGATTSYRYRLYQLIPLAFLYLFLLLDQKKLIAKHFSMILILSILLYGFRIEYNLDLLRKQVRQLKTGFLDLQITGAYDQLSFRAPELGAALLDNLAKKGIYNGYGVDVAIPPLLNLPWANPMQPMQYMVDSIDDQETYYKIRGWAFPAHSPVEAVDIYLMVKSGNDYYYYPTGPFLNKNLLMEKSENGFVGIINRKMIPYDWKTSKTGLALRHPFQGIIAIEFLTSEQ
jgi:hypothetical protein